MVYYSPYKQIWRAFIRAVRTFISSLFSKRLLLMIIVALVIMLLHLNVHAESINESGYVYRTRIISQYNENENIYNLSGTFYSQNGRHDVDIDIPSNMYQGSFFIAYFSKYDAYLFVRMHDQRDFDSFYLNCIKRYGDYHLYYCLNPKSYGISNLDTFIYTEDNNTWTTDYINVSGDYYWDDTFPSDIIFQKGCSVYYTYDTSSTIYSSYQLINYSVFQIPQLSLLSNAFKLDLNGFGFYGQEFDDRFNTQYFTHKYQLEHLYISLYDINNSQFVFSNTDIISLIDVVTNGYDDITGYPIQSTILDFNTFFNYLNNTSVNGDYVIFISPFLKDSYYFNDIPIDMAQYYTYFNDVSYYRYQYYANSGSSLLVPSDAEGNPIDNSGEGGNNEWDNSNIENQNTIDNSVAIQEQTNAINNMSDFLQNHNFSSDSIINNMPSSDEFQDVTESGFDNIFTTLRNAFTSDNYQDVEFIVPFSNGQKITLPSNLTENIIPTAIKTLIQMVYWYFIARFIVKDIASYIEKAKSGDIFSSSDSNIKTDML